MNRKETIVYHINEDKKKVVAVLNVPEDSFINETMSIFNKACGSSFRFEEAAFGAEMLVKGTYRGVATCHEKDTFDIETGKKVARLKAVKAYMKERKNLTHRLTVIIADLIIRSTDADRHAANAIENIEKTLSEMKKG